MSFGLKLKNGDLSIKSGKLENLTGSDKLIQDILKACITDVGANPLNPGYGSYLSKNIIGSSLDNKITIAMAQTQIRNSVELLMELQKIQFQTFQKMSPDEQIAQILDISILRNTSDYRVYTVSVSVLTKSFQRKTANFALPA